MSLNTFTYLREHSLFALFYLDKKRRGRGEVAVSMEKRSMGVRWGAASPGWEITGCHGDVLNQKYG